MLARGADESVAVLLGYLTVLSRWRPSTGISFFRFFVQSLELGGVPVGSCWRITWMLLPGEALRRMAARSLTDEPQAPRSEGSVLALLLMRSTSDISDRTHIRAVPRHWNNHRSAWLATIRLCGSSIMCGSDERVVGYSAVCATE